MLTTQSFNPNQIRLAPFDYEEITLGAVALPLDATKRKRAWLVWLRVEGGDCRFRVDGLADPTAAVGVRGYDTDQITLSPEEAQNFKAILLSNAPVLRVVYYQGGP